jgi:hypothetical protein
MGQGDGQFEIAAHGNLEPLGLAAVDGDLERCGADPVRRGCPLSSMRRVRVTASPMMAKAGAFFTRSAAVPVVLAAGAAGAAARAGRARAPDRAAARREQDDAGDPGARLLGQRLGQRGHQLRAGIALAVGTVTRRTSVFSRPAIRLSASAASRSGRAGPTATGWRFHPPPAARCRSAGAVLLLIGPARQRGQQRQGGKAAQAQPDSRARCQDHARQRDGGGDGRIGQGSRGSKTTLAVIGPACREGRARGPDRICSCRSARASRGSRRSG